jgi:hypothetical protein
MPDVGPLFHAVGPAIVPTLAALVAIWGVVTQRAIARRRATLDCITKAEADTDIIGARRKFIELAICNDGGLAKFAEQNCEATEEAQKIRLVLNEFELMAIGIQRGIIDFELYKRWNKSSVLKYWKHAQPFVTRLRARTDNSAYFHEFEQMAGWLRDDKMPARGRFWALFF